MLPNYGALNMGSTPYLSHLKILLLLLPVGISGCQQPEAETVVESIRPIKTITLTSKVSAADQHSFPGIVRAADSSSLSFEVSGKILDIKVDVGAPVTRGQVLAIMDDESFKLAIQLLEADLRKAQADFNNQDSNYTRKKKLIGKGFVSASEMDQARADRETARNQTTMALSQLDIARKDLRNTALKAPFDGHISKRLAEPFQKISSGQKVFEIDALGDMEVKVVLSENIIGQLKKGDTGEVTFPGLKETKIQCVVAEIGTHAERANAFPVTLRLLAPGSDLLPGMTAVAQLTIAHNDQADGFLLPASAIVAGAGKSVGQHFVFIYDPENKTVRKASVMVGGGKKDLARVIEGIEIGDTIAVAGASFLSDGMQVHLLEEAQR